VTTPKRLTDALIWILLNTPGLSDAALAAALHVNAPLDQPLEVRHRHIDMQDLSQLLNREGTGGEVFAPRGMLATLDSLMERVASQRC
jgi:hypothetical protein